MLPWCKVWAAGSDQKRPRPSKREGQLVGGDSIQLGQIWNYRAGMRCRCRRGSWARRYEYEDPLKAAEREERDRRRAEVRRYPIDDTELHAELNKKASSDGMPWTVDSCKEIRSLLNGQKWLTVIKESCATHC